MSDTGQRIRRIIRSRWSFLDADKITDDVTFAEVQFDPLDLIEICMECEKEFGIYIPLTEWSHVKTMGDAIKLIDAKTGVPA